MDDVQPRHTPGSAAPGLRCAWHGAPLIYYLERKYPDGEWEHVYICERGHVCGREPATREQVVQLQMFEEAR